MGIALNAYTSQHGNGTVNKPLKKSIIRPGSPLPPPPPPPRCCGTERPSDSTHRLPQPGPCQEHGTAVEGPGCHGVTGSGRTGTAEGPSSPAASGRGVAGSGRRGGRAGGKRDGTGPGGARQASGASPSRRCRCRCRGCEGRRERARRAGSPRAGRGTGPAGCRGRTGAGTGGFPAGSPGRAESRSLPAPPAGLSQPRCHSPVPVPVPVPARSPPAPLTAGLSPPRLSHRAPARGSLARRAALYGSLSVAPSRCVTAPSAGANQKAGLRACRRPPNGSGAGRGLTRGALRKGGSLAERAAAATCERVGLGG